MYLYTTQGIIGVQDQDFVCNYLNNGNIHVRNVVCDSGM